MSSMCYIHKCQNDLSPLCLNKLKLKMPSQQLYPQFDLWYLRTRSLFDCKYRLQWRIQDFPWGGGGRGPRRRGCGLPRQLRFENFVCQNERIGTLRGGARAGRAPLDPPMGYFRVQWEGCFFSWNWPIKNTYWLGVWIDTYVFYQSVFARIWSLCVAKT